MDHRLFSQLATDELIDKLLELRDLAQASLPATDMMTTKQWAKARLARIARTLRALDKTMEKSTGEQT